MPSSLVVVESPTKVRTIKKYLGKDFNVVATLGHIKDLPQREIGIDIEKGFTPKYGIIPGKQKVISNLKKAAGSVKDIYLAPDPDREGEAIAWHTAEVLQKKGRAFHRVLFHELTKKAILEAISSPGELDAAKYEAQKARRILDRLVGYRLSPLLWRKVKGGLSAGRVQSVAVRIICERERAIFAFEPEEYWTIQAHLAAEQPPLVIARLAKKDGKKLTIPNQDASDQILKDLSGAEFVVDKVEKRTVKRNPLPPFTTSKLQQDAIHRLRFTAKKTMVVAQQLYEGVELLPGEPVGLITYMRTDSTRISAESADEARELIKERFGDPYALAKPRFFKNSKKVQDAHEAIRPTSVFNTPESVKSHLSREQYALYTLIWERFVASQMKEALIDQTRLFILANGYLFTASGSIIKFPGFMAAYRSGNNGDAGKKEGLLPPVEQGEALDLKKLDPKQHFTQPPPRFSEASLVKELEENGIGRPSTYAAILSTIRDKGYVEMKNRYFVPSELGFIVNDLLVKNFPDVLDVAFTAHMEEDLDRVETVEADSKQILSDFYNAFAQKLELAAKKMESVKGVGLPSGLSCPKCKKPLNIKMGRNGHFLACSGYPECDFTRDYVRDEKGRIQPKEPVAEEPTNEKCDKCGRFMIKKQGPYGPFLACSGYPECKNTRSLNQEGAGKQIGVKCPRQGCSGVIVQKVSKRGKIFFGCNQYPKCDFATWDKPTNRTCPKCNSGYLLEKTTKKQGVHLVCSNKSCDYKEIPAPDGN